MPTPFTHLAYNQHLLTDDALPADLRALLTAHLPAYLLGGVAADGHTLAGLKREDTHFYAYDRPMTDHPYRVMTAQHPVIPGLRGAGLAFTLGYVAHLALDEVWALDMMKAHFVDRQWADRPMRFLMLHALLIHMDERDLAALTGEIAPALGAAQPAGWSPFMPDPALCAWRDVIHRQIVPGGVSETYAIIAPRVSRTEAEIAGLMADEAGLERDLWAHIPRSLLASVEARMMLTARDQMIAYWEEISV